jgi:hypothetical protein
MHQSSFRKTLAVGFFNVLPLFLILLIGGATAFSAARLYLQEYW